ncbi:MAG: hypothetical protein CMA31_07155 [Euryarchaeota archaeon]|nr:hypothetical protein [Euryarchaeota archaeon]RPG71515.1 MAG: hypothetical protein CBD52_004790 [Euryarchaeota archaeon TMED192]
MNEHRLENYNLRTLAVEYVYFCAVGTVNVLIFLAMYSVAYSMAAGIEYRAASAWSVSYLLSSLISHSMHRWFTFRSISPYGRSLALTMTVYTILLIISTFSQAILADSMGFDHLAIWALNTAAFGFLSFVALRFIAFPMSDGTISVRERIEIVKLGRRS